MGTVGSVLVLPYIFHQTHTQLAKVSADIGIGIGLLLTLVAVQSTFLVAICVWAGLWSSKKLGMGTPILSTAINGGPWQTELKAIAKPAILVGLIIGVVVCLLDLAGSSLGAPSLLADHPPIWMGFLASFYGAINEEIFLRLGVLTLIALLIRAIGRVAGGWREQLPATAFWLANATAAVLFGLGHLPGNIALYGFSAVLLFQTLMLNGLVGITAGVLFRKYGLEAAMIMHFSCDLILHVVAPALQVP
ncbi:hypothetical protein AYO42_00935 [Rhizomicrobium sp. SCGC AG-212-E05]|nr:hypothetical protein AYO42_00935 [Rhizomicrobium sp. SCGC AG-212-E05]